MAKAYDITKKISFFACVIKILRKFEDRYELNSDFSDKLLVLIQYFDSFNATLGKQIMPELEAEVRQRIKEKGWTTEGMTAVE